MTDQEMLDVCHQVQAKTWNEAVQFAATVNPPKSVAEYVLEGTGAVTIGAIAGLTGVWCITKLCGR